jgi:hypothetical protein
MPMPRAACKLFEEKILHAAKSPQAKRHHQKSVSRRRIGRNIGPKKKPGAAGLF